MPTAFYLVLLVQFVSTLADNALLIVAIARSVELDSPAWIVPVIKISFTVFYVVLAPLAGPVADAFAKGRVMLAANALKTMAALLLLAGVHPAWAIGLAGLGAAAYAPAKYGLITELLPARDLVRANGFFESVTVTAVILGTVLGGLLVSPLMPVWHLSLGTVTQNDSVLAAAMAGLLALNLLATLLSVGVKDSGARYDPHSIHPVALFKRFYQENRLLWRDPVGGLSMAVTSLLWAVGATLQLIVLRWAHEALGLSLTQAAYLQGITALGVIVGAVAASRWVALGHAAQLMPLGIVLGLAVPLMLAVDTVWVAAMLLVVVGAVAGFFVVPMNALLQHRGCQLLTAGRSIAVQGFNENAGILLMLAVYAWGTAANVSLPTLVWGLGLWVTGGMAFVYLAKVRLNKGNHS